jgi:hypothetical protein
MKLKIKESSCKVCPYHLDLRHKISPVQHNKTTLSQGKRYCTGISKVRAFRKSASMAIPTWCPKCKQPFTLARYNLADHAWISQPARRQLGFPPWRGQYKAPQFFETSLSAYELCKLLEHQGTMKTIEDDLKVELTVCDVFSIDDGIQTHFFLYDDARICFLPYQKKSDWEGEHD